jgi:hypothetical protein
MTKSIFTRDLLAAWDAYVVEHGHHPSYCEFRGAHEFELGFLGFTSTYQTTDTLTEARVAKVNRVLAPG